MLDSKLKDIKILVKDHTIEEVAKLLNINDIYLRTVCKAYKIPYLKNLSKIDKYKIKHNLSDKDIKKIFKEHTREELIKFFDTTIYIVSNYAYRHNYSWKREYKRKEKNILRDEEILKLREKMTYREIGEKYNISPQRVEQLIKRYYEKNNYTTLQF